MTDPGLATASAFKQSDEIEQYENNDEKYLTSEVWKIDVSNLSF